MVNVTESGRCAFRLYMPNAGSVELVGSFCEWKLDRSSGVLELERDADGWWNAWVNLPVGDHEFCYLVDGRAWMPDYAASGVRRDNSGRWVSLLNIPGRSDTRADVRTERPIGATAEPRISQSAERESRWALVHAG